MNTLTRPSPQLSLLRLFALVWLAAALLAACSQEPKQRAAFIDFLQTRVLSAKGGAIPLLGQQDKDALGADYAQQYAVIENFHQALNNSVSAPARKMLQTGSFNSLGDIIKRRGELKLLRGSLQQLRTALDENLTKADAAHAAMQQPDDLKTVYDKAYHKAVTSPANGYKDIFPAMERLFDSIDQVADYVDSHQAQVQVTGSMVQVQDPKILAELNALIEQIERNSKALNDIQAQFIKAMNGG